MLDSMKMLEHMKEQGIALKRTLEKYEDLEVKIEPNRIFVIGAGDKYAVPLIAQYLWRSNIPLKVMHSRTFLAYPPAINEKSLVIAISQSGKTWDTVNAVRLAMEKKAYVVGITNLREKVENSFAEIEDYEKGLLLRTLTTFYPEKPLPSTQTFFASLGLLSLLLLKLQKKDTSDLLKVAEYVHELSNAKEVTEWAKEKAKELAPFAGYAIYFFGDGPRYGLARRSALILFMEGAKQDAFAIETEEFVHSAIETLEKENMPKPSIVLIPPKSSPLRELAEKVHAFWSKFELSLALEPYQFGEFEIKCNEDVLSTFLQAVPLGYLAYEFAQLKGVDPGVCTLVKKVRGEKF